jgi:Domain of unknown function (DUF4091)
VDSTPRFTRRQVILGAGAGVGALGLAACTPGPGGPRGRQDRDPRVRVVGPTDKVRPTDAQIGGTEVTATAAGGEIVAFQVVATATTGDISGVTVAVESPLVGRQTQTEIPAKNIVLYRVAYVTIRRATYSGTSPASLGRWPDPLIPATDPLDGQPRNAFPITIPSGENRIAWVEVQIPANTLPDDYIGSVRVTGSGLGAVVPISITVMNFNLPSTSRLTTAFIAGMNAACKSLGYDLNTRGWGVLAKFIRLGLNNRVTVCTMLRLLPEGQGNQRQNFEQTILPMIDGSAQGLRLPGAQMTSIQTPGNANVAELATWRDEANAHGFTDRAFAYSALCDEIAGTGKSWTTCRDDFVASVLRTWPDVAILLTGTVADAQAWQDRQPPGPLALVDGVGGRLRLTVIIQQMDGESGPYAGEQRAKYDEFLTNTRHSLWLYSSCESWSCGQSGPRDEGWAGGYAVDQPGSRARAMAWLCYRFKASGELYYDTTVKMTTAWSPGGLWNFGGNGDGTLFYPGTPDQDIGDDTKLGGTDAVPLESIRLKLICLGLQDWEWLVELAGRGGDAQALAARYFPAAYGIQATDDIFRRARNEIALALKALP